MDGTTLVVNFNEELASVSGLTNSAFTVTKTYSGGSEKAQVLSGTPTVSGETVTRTLSSPVIASDMETVKVSYTAPTEPGAKLRDAEGSDVENLMDLKVLNICSRTEVVRVAILAQITRTVSCNEVTGDDLRTITFLDLSQRDITELKSGDFIGLTRLRQLLLYSNALTNLDPDLFEGLTSLERLGLSGNDLGSLPQDLFEGLTSLESLGLNENDLTDLHEDLFDGLTSLESLGLYGNDLTDLHEDLFDGLTSLELLWLFHNDLTDLDPDLFEGLTSLQVLYLYGNGLESLHEDLFEGLTNLGTLELGRNDLTDLDPDLFEGLTNLGTLELGRNDLTDLDPDLFEGLTSLQVLYLDGNGLESPQEDLFEGLTSLERLYLHNNDLTDLDPDLFEGLTNLQVLYLSGNGLESPHEDLFEGLTSLESLYLHNNDLTDLDPDLFDGLINLQDLDLYVNALTSLHPDLFDDVEVSLVVALHENPLTCVPAEILNQQNITINPSSLRVACPDPSITLSTNPQTIGEEDEATEVTVTATLNVVQATATPVTVSVGSGTATSETDFAAVSDFIISIPTNIPSATGTFTLMPTSDTVDEPDETVIVTGTSAVESVTVTETHLTITDDEAAPTVTLILSSTSIPENVGSSTVTATLNHPSSEETTISISVDPTSPATASDYQLSENLTLTIDAGEIESAGLVTITSVDNLVDAPDKTVQVQGTTENTQGVTGPSAVELTITDDEDEPMITLTLAPVSISENAGTTTVTATLNRPSSEGTTILISAVPDAPAAATDFALSGNLRLTIAAGETGSTGLVTIAALDNEVDAPDKTVQVQGAATNLQGVIGPEAVELTITDDDQAPAMTLSLSPVSITENNGFATITATLDRPSSEGTTVTITTLPDAPATELDYMQEGDLLTIAAGETESTGLVTITAVDNAVNAPNKTVQVQGIATNGQGLTGPEEVELTILDDDLTPTVTLLLSSASIGENGGLTTVTAELSRPSSEPTTIEITVLPNAPATESDYMLRGTTLTIAAGETGSSGVVTIIAVDNATDAPDRTVQVQGEVTRSLGVTSPPAVQLRITDDEPTPTVTLMLDPSTIEENGASTTVTALLSHPSSARTTVVVSALANPPAVASDLMLSQNTILTIAAGGTESTGLMTITAIDNPVDAPDKTVQVQGVATNSQGVSVPADVVLTITDDDEVSPTVSLILAPASIGENDGQTTVTATMEPPSSAVTTIVVSVLPDAPATASDYQISENPTLTIAAGETGSTGRVTITAVDNEVSAPDKTLQVQGTATNPRGVTGPVAVELTITDDEALPTVMLLLDPSTIKENGGETAVTASLNRISGTVTTIEVTVLPNAPTTASDYQISENSMLTIAAGETESTGLVTITAVDNEVDAPEKTVQVQGIVTSAQGITDPVEVELTITDDEAAPAVTLLLDPAAIAENGESTTVTATLDRASDEETSIELTVLPDAPATTSDYVLSDPLTLTIAAGELTSTGLVTITAVDNEVDAPDKTVQVQGVATNALGTTNPSSVELTITDDDEAPAVTLTLSPASISENAGTTTVTATLNRPSSAMTTIAVTVLPNAPAMESDYRLSDNQTLTIAAGETESTGLMTITAVDNEVDAPDKIIQVQGRSTNTQGVTDPEEVTLTITDDDESFPVAQDATVTTEEDTPHPFGISDFGYNDPEGDPLASVRIERHPDAGTLTLGGIGFAAGTQISVAQISAGELIFTPVANAYGPAYTSFDFKVSDGTSESPLAARMIIDVTAVNDEATGRPQIIGSMQVGQVLRVSVEEIQDLDGLRRAQAGEPGYGYRYQWLRMKEGSPHEPIGEGDTYVPVDIDAGASLVVQVSFVDDAGFEESLESPPRQVRSTNRIRTAWMGRLGRTVADQVLRATQCEGRVQRSRRNEVYLAGRPLALASLPNYVRVQEVKPDRHAVLLGMTDPVVRLGHTLTRERLLHGSSFRHGMRDGSGVALWGHGAVSRVQGADGALNLEGRVSSGMFGADWIRDKGGLGVLVAYTRSEGEYAMASDEGTHSAYLTGVYPNGCYALSSGITAWGVVGYGRGSMTVEQVSTPMDLRMVGGGIYGRLGAVRNRGLELGIRSDALLVQMGASETEELSEDQAQVSRLRLGLQGTMRGIRLGTQSTIEPVAELALRHDGGDAETGFGVDMQVGFRLSEPASGLDIEVHAHAVLTHQDRGLQDQGLAGAVTWDPQPHSSEGLQVRVEHTIGAEALGGAERLLRAETIQPQYRTHQTEDLRVQAGYGFALFSRAFTLQPEVSFSGGGPQRRYEMGWNIARAHEHPTKVQLFVGTTGQAQRDSPLQLRHLIRLQLKREF